MAKIYDLSSYLEEKKSSIKIGDKEYEISDGFNDLLKIDALSNRRDEMGATEFVQEFLKLALGEENAKELISKNYRIELYMKIMNCIEDVYSGSSKEGASSEDKNTEMV